MKSRLADIVRSNVVDRTTQTQLARRIYDTTLACCAPIQSGNFECITNRELEFVFKATDDLFFDGEVRKFAHDAGFPLTFRLSKRMTNAGGTTKMTMPHNNFRKKEFEIAISSTLLFASFREGAGKATIVTGSPCLDRLEALQRIMEHELLHMVELLLWHDSNCSARRFRGIAQRIFGHSQSNHELLRPRDLARRDHGIAPGDWVQFTHRGKRLSGKVNRITKRATILVPNSEGIRYNDGKRYVKFYVPYEMLQKSA